MVPALKSQPEMVTAATVYEKLPKIFIGESGISIAEKEIASVICGLRRGGKTAYLGHCSPAKDRAVPFIPLTNS